LSSQLRTVSRHFDDRLIDTHSLAVTGRTLFATSTGRDSVLEYQIGNGDLEFRTAHRLSQASADTLHVNSVCIHEGRVLVGMFGEGWRNQPTDARTGLILDLESRQPVSTSIRHPHSLCSRHDKLYVLGSSFGTVEQVHPGGGRTVCARFSGYLRGLFIFEYGAIVGVSRNRHPSRVPDTASVETASTEDRCGVLRFDKDWELIDFVDLSWVGPEIFDLALISPEIPAPTIHDTFAAAKHRIALFESAWAARHE